MLEKPSCFRLALTLTCMPSLRVTKLASSVNRYQGFTMPRLAVEAVGQNQHFSRFDVACLQLHADVTRLLP